MTALVDPLKRTMATTAFRLAAASAGAAALKEFVETFKSMSAARA